MTLKEFEESRSILSCRACGHVGLEPSPRHPNNGGIRPICPACGSQAPLVDVQWLKQNGAAERKLRRVGTPRPDDVWSANGNHCGFCGKPRSLCERLGIGLTVQHLVPVVFGGADESPLVPFCARCQEWSVAALRETRDVLGELEALDDVIRQSGATHPGPDPLANDAVDQPA